MDVCYVWMCVELFHMDVCGIVMYGSVWTWYVWNGCMWNCCV